MYTQDQINEAKNKAKSLAYSKITEYYCGFIVMAQNEIDFKVKCRKIDRGDCVGFYTVERLLSIISA